MTVASSVSTVVRALRLRVVQSQLIRNAGVLTLSNGLVAVLGLVQTLVVARWLGPELLGVAALVVTYPALLYTVFDARSVDASVKYLTQFQHHRQHERALAMCKLGYGIDVLVALAGLGAVAATASWAAENIVHESGSAWLTIIYAGGLAPRALVGTSSAVLASLGLFSRIAWFDVFTSIIRVALIIGFVRAGWQVSGIVWGTVVAAWVSGLLYAVTAIRVSRRTWQGFWWHASIRGLQADRTEVFRFLGYNSLTTTLGLIPKHLDILLLGYFRGPVETGFYKLARSLSGVVSYIVSPLQLVTYTMLTNVAARSRKELRQQVRRLATQVSVPLSVALLLGVLLVPAIISIALGRSYELAVRPLQLLLVGSASWLAGFWLRPLFFVRGELRAWANISLLFVLLSLGGFALIIPSWGYVGLAAWLMLMHVTGHAFAAGYAQRKGWI